MVKILISSIFFITQVFGQVAGPTREQLEKATQDKRTFLEADIKYTQSLLEFQLKKLGIYQDFMEKGADPVFIESRNAAAVAFAGSLLALSGVVAVMQHLDRAKMTPEQYAKYREWYKKNKMGSVKGMIILMGSLLMVIPASGLMVDDFKISYTRDLSRMSGEQLQYQHTSTVEIVTRYSESIQSAKIQLDSLK